MIVFSVVLAFLWWKSAEMILVDGWRGTLDVHRYDLYFMRTIAIFGPVVALVIRLAWAWCDAPQDDTNPIVKESKR